jgi:hypothetical protein
MSLLWDNNTLLSCREKNVEFYRLALIIIVVVFLFEFSTRVRAGDEVFDIFTPDSATSCTTTLPCQIFRQIPGHRMASGNCLLQSAFIEFRQNGVAHIWADIITQHTHSGDQWNLIGAMALNDNSKSFIKEFTSTVMDDDHGWYKWAKDVSYDAAAFGKIATFALNGNC